MESEIASAVAERQEQQRAQLQAQVDAGGAGEEDETVEMREKRAEELEAVREDIRERRRPEIEVVKRAVANAWIAEMRFARRSDVSGNCAWRQDPATRLLTSTHPLRRGSGKRGRSS